MPKIRKSSSKRSSLKHKYSIAKKIKDSKKKIKKEAKKFKAMGIAPRKMKKQISEETLVGAACMRLKLKPPRLLIAKLASKPQPS